MNIASIKYHVVFGDAACGTIRFYLENVKKISGTIVINLPSDFSYGPLLDLNKEYGELNRISWLEEILRETNRNDEGTIEHYHQIINFCKVALKGISSDDNVLIWYGRNVSDYIGLRYISSLLDFSDKIFKINVSDFTLKASNSNCYIPRSLGEVSSLDVDLLVDKYEQADIYQWMNLRQDWDLISKETLNLRVLIGEHIICVTNDYYDHLIITCCDFYYLNCARVIGSVLGKSEQLIDDMYIDWRIRLLLKQGKLKGRGRFRDIRSFEIRKRYINI